MEETSASLSTMPNSASTGWSGRIEHLILDASNARLSWYIHILLTAASLLTLSPLSGLHRSWIFVAIFISGLAAVHSLARTRFS